MSRSSVVAGSGYAAGPMTEIVDDSGQLQRLLIVNDVKLYRDALAVRLSQIRRVTVVGAIHSAEVAEAIDRLCPNMMLYDVHDWTSLEHAQQIAQRRPGLKIVAIAVPEIARHAVAATSSDIAGWISRTESIDDVIDLIIRLSDRHHGALETVLMHRDNGDQPGKKASPELTPRESEILRMIERGLSNKEIARDLRIEVGTVKNHVHNILEKLNVRRRDQAAYQMRQSLSE